MNSTIAEDEETEVVCSNCGYLNRMGALVDPVGWSCGHCDEKALVRRKVVPRGDDRHVALASLGAVIGSMLLGPPGTIVGAVVGFFAGKLIWKEKPRQKKTKLEIAKGKIQVGQEYVKESIAYMNDLGDKNVVESLKKAEKHLMEAAETLAQKMEK